MVVRVMMDYMVVTRSVLGRLLNVRLLQGGRVGTSEIYLMEETVREGTR